MFLLAHKWQKRFLYTQSDRKYAAAILQPSNRYQHVGIRIASFSDLMIVYSQHVMSA